MGRLSWAPHSGANSDTDIQLGPGSLLGRSAWTFSWMMRACVRTKPRQEWCHGWHRIEPLTTWMLNCWSVVNRVPSWLGPAVLFLSLKIPKPLLPLDYRVPQNLPKQAYPPGVSCCSWPSFQSCLSDSGPC